jgi:hypothetical protein
MSIFLAWVVFPPLLCGLALGCGLLLDHMAGQVIPGVLVLPAGFAVVIVASTFTTMSAATASFTSPLVVALAVAGVGLSLRDRRRLNAWAAGAALAVFAVYAAPIVLSGSATFAGYMSLDDTATWLALTDNALTHGRSFGGLAPSTYSEVLRVDLGTGYPIGSMLPLGVGHDLTGQDGAWLFQPYLAFVAAMISLSAYALVSPLVGRRSLRAAVAFIGAQPALLFGYALWSGVKEVVVAALVALVAALAASALTARSPLRIRALIPLALAAAAVLACLNVLGVVWLAGLVMFAVLFVGLHGARRAVVPLEVAVVCGLVLAIPALATARQFVHVSAGSDAGHGTIGNLFHPLSSLQLLGIWPTGDFRGRPAHMVVTYVLLALLVGAAAFAIVEAVRRRAWGIPLYALTSVLGWCLVAVSDRLGHGSPWLDAKALASASPALLVAGLVGVVLMLERKRELVATAGAVGLVAIAAGVVWSNALAYGAVWLAPRNQLTELETIGKRFAGDGPALMTEYQPYGARHFLRNLDPEGASELRYRPVNLRNGNILSKAQYADLDAFDLEAVLVYRTLVLRTSPLESRPPSVYTPVWNGRWYDVWQRPEHATRIFDHISLGSDTNPDGVPVCADVLRLAKAASRDNGTLVASVRRQPITISLSGSELPNGWLPGTNGTVVPTGVGTLTETVVILQAGRFGFWLGGSFRDRVRLYLDGRLVGAARDQLENTAQLTPLGSALLTSGQHTVTLRYDGRGWRPGSRGPQFAFGPLVVGTSASSARLIQVAPSDARSLCGGSFDWIEQLPGG